VKSTLDFTAVIIPSDHQTNIKFQIKHIKLLKFKITFIKIKINKYFIQIDNQQFMFAQVF
jgi:hypothetical protein